MQGLNMYIDLGTVTQQKSWKGHSVTLEPKGDVLDGQDSLWKGVWKEAKTFIVEIKVPGSIP